MTSHNQMLAHPHLTFSQTDDGTIEARFDMQGWGGDVVSRYWRQDAPGRDAWTYDLARINGKGGRYTHPTEHGCRLMIVQHLIDAGLIGPSEDNSHLDARNAEIAARAQAARDNFTGRPRLGDFVIMPSGKVERCCAAWDDGMQTTEGGSWHVSTSGTCSFSGGLNASQLWESFKPTEETRLGRFWFFSHGQPGAGRGVDVFLPCRVYRLEPPSMTEAEARAHPVARRCADFWCENSRDHLRKIARLMEGRT